MSYLAFLIFSSIASLSFLPCILSSDLTSLFYTMSTPDLVQYVDDGQEIHLALDQKNASGFESYDAYLYGNFNMRIKLVSGDSAGTVTTYYFSSLGSKHDELDFEFLGNASGQPLILQTNVYASGVGGREQRISLWFDPTTDFHNYTLLWNQQIVVFFVDDKPIRVFPNIEAETGVPYLHNQSMNVYATIWDGDSWATEGGRIKVNWTHAPFVASYRDFSADACTQTATTSASECAATKWWDQAAYQALDSTQLSQLKWVQDTLMEYNYCTDYARYNVTPPECLYSMVSTPSPSSSPSSPSSSPPSSSSLPLIASPSPSPSPYHPQSNSPSPPHLTLFCSSFLFIILSLLFHPYL